METWQYKALEDYKQGKYENSVKLFNRAVEACKDDRLVQLLDQRSLCWIRLKNHDNALKDAKAMIRHDKQNPKGYIRLGLVLRDMGHKKSASKIFDQGLTRVDVNHKAFKLLRDLSVEHQQVNERGYNMVTALPYEMVHEVFANLPFKTVVRCMRVCANWNAFLRNDPRLWSGLIDFSRVARKHVSKKLLINYARLGQPLSRLNLCNMKPEIEAQCMNVVRRLERFDSLELTLSTNCLHLLQGIKVNTLTIHIKFAAGVCLFDFIQTIHVDDLTIYGDPTTDYEFVTTESIAVPSLSKLRLVGGFPRSLRMLDQMKNLDTFHEVCRNGEVRQLPPTVTNLKLDHYKPINLVGLGSFGNNTLEHMEINHGYINSLEINQIPDYSNLHTLVLTHLESTTKKFLQFCQTRRILNVQTLVLDNAMFEKFDQGFTAALSDQLPKLSSLSVGRTDNFNDDSVSGISLPLLTSININYTKVTDRGVLALLQQKTPGNGYTRLERFIKSV